MGCNCGGKKNKKNINKISKSKSSTSKKASTSSKLSESRKRRMVTIRAINKTLSKKN